MATDYEPVPGDTPQHGPECPCESCVALLKMAAHYVDTNLLQTKPDPELVPFIMHLRTETKKHTPLGLAGRSEIITAEGDAGPWGEKAQREYEDRR